MHISDRGLRLITEFEGYYGDPYKDPVGVWTIGYGHTGSDVHRLGHLSEPQARALLRKDLAGFEAGVNRLVKVPLTQGQFDALVSFSYNVGLGAFGSSTLLKKLNVGDYYAAATEFKRWVHGGGRILPGLVRRRNAERALFQSEPPPRPKPMPKSKFKTPVRTFQRWSNAFVRGTKLPLVPLAADGKPGPATNHRIVDCKWYLGYAKRYCTSELTDLLIQQVGHYNQRFLFNVFQFARALYRRRQARQRAGRQVNAGETYPDDRGRRWKIDADDAPNLVWFDDRPVAKWIAPILRDARASGTWKGHVTNGWRSYAHQWDIYYVQKIRPAALPGQSNHQGSVYPRGAVDVSDYSGLNRYDQQHGTKLVWYGSGDLVHFSATGR